MIYKNVSKEQAIKIVSSILYEIDPVGLRIYDVPENEYDPEAKLIVELLDKRVLLFRFWKDIHNVLLNNYEKDIEKRMCEKISEEIGLALSLRSFADELRENPLLKNVDDDLCLTIHDDFKVRFDFSEKVFINDEYYCSCEEQDIELLLAEMVKDDEKIYAIYSRKYSFFKKSHIKEFNKQSFDVNSLIKDDRVLMIFDNKSLIYKR